MPDATLEIFCLSPSTSEMGNLKPRKVKSPAQGHTAREEPSLIRTRASQHTTGRKGPGGRAQGGALHSASMCSVKQHRRQDITSPLLFCIHIFQFYTLIKGCESLN